MKIATVCSGIGSPEQALRELGIPHEISFACEIDKYARKSYLANFDPDLMLTDMTKESFIGKEYYSDLFIGGIPCQSFSLAGKRLGELEPRGLLFYDYYRYVKKQQPKYFIIENVKGLLSDNDGNTFQNWINLLGQSVNGTPFFFPHEDSLLYNLHWEVLNTKDYELPQNRERVFLVGIRNDLPNNFNFPGSKPLKLRLKDVLEKYVNKKYYLSKKMIDGFISHSERHREKGNGFKFETKDTNSIANTITTTEGSRGYNNFIKEGYINQNTQASQVFSEDGISPTLASGTHGYANGYVKIGAVRGRNPENPKSRKSGLETEQMLEINENGVSNCLSTVQKYNLVIEYKKEIIQLNNPVHSNDRVYDSFGISPALNTMQGGNRQPFIYNDFSIRKLTPLECFRLQGYPDLFFYNCERVNSDTQLYKQAGNTISVTVIKAILKNLLKNETTY